MKYSLPTDILLAFSYYGTFIIVYNFLDKVQLSFLIYSLIFFLTVLHIFLHILHMILFHYSFYYKCLHYFINLVFYSGIFFVCLIYISRIISIFTYWNVLIRFLLNFIIAWFSFKKILEHEKGFQFKYNRFFCFCAFLIFDSF